MNATFHPLCTQDPRVLAASHEKSYRLYDLAHKVAAVVKFVLQVLVICIFTKVVALPISPMLPTVGWLVAEASASHFSKQAEEHQAQARVERGVEVALEGVGQADQQFLQARMDYYQSEIGKAKAEAREKPLDKALHRTLLLKVVALIENFDVLDAIRENPHNIETPITRSHALHLIGVA